MARMATRFGRNFVLGFFRAGYVSQRVLSFAKTRSCADSLSPATLSVELADQWLIAKINQHGMVLIIALADIEIPVSRPI